MPVFKFIASMNTRRRFTNLAQDQNEAVLDTLAATRVIDGDLHPSEEAELRESMKMLNWQGGHTLEQYIDRAVQRGQELRPEPAVLRPYFEDVSQRLGEDWLRQETYYMAARITLADGEVDESERVFLQALVEAFEIPGDVQALIIRKIREEVWSSQGGVWGFGSAAGERGDQQMLFRANGFGEGILGAARRQEVICSDDERIAGVGHLKTKESRRMSFRLTTGWVFSLLVLFSLGCATSSNKKVDDQEPQQIRSAEDLIQSPDVLWAVKLTPDGLSALLQILKSMDNGGVPQLGRIEQYEEDLIGGLQRELEMPNDLPSLRRDQAMYVQVTSRGNETFLRAAELGLPTREEEWPTYLNVRLLLPSDSAESLQTEVSGWLDELVAQGVIEGRRVEASAGFVRVDIAASMTGDAELGGQVWLDGLGLEQVQPPSAAQYRATPAYLSFIDGETTAGVWLPIGTMMGMMTLADWVTFRTDYRNVGPMGKARFFLEGVSTLASSSLAMDPVSAEHEDLAVTVWALDEQGVMVDVVVSRTAQGMRMYEALKSTVSMPGMNVADSILSMRWAGDIGGLQQNMVRPYWALMEGDEADEWLEFEQMGRQGMLQKVDWASEMAVMLMEMQYPGALIGMAVEELAGAVPLPEAISLEAFRVENPEPGALPIGLAAVVVFENNVNNRQSIEQALGMANMAIPLPFDATLVDRDDELLEVRVAIGSELNKVFSSGAPPVPVSEVRASLRLAPLFLALPGMVPNTAQFELFEEIHLRSLSEPAYTSMRSTLGNMDAMDPVRIQGAAELLRNPTDRCRNEMAGLSRQYLRDLRAAPAEVIEEWAGAVRSRAMACYGDDQEMLDFIEARLELAGQIGAQIP